MLSHIMRSLFLLSLLHQMFVTSEFYTITCMRSVTVQCEGTAIVECNHTGQLKQVTIGWTNNTKGNLTLNITNGTTKSEDGQVEVNDTYSEVKLEIHHVSVSDVVHVCASAVTGHKDVQVNVIVDGGCDSKNNGKKLLENKTSDSDDITTEPSAAQKQERSKSVAVSVLVVFAVLLVLAILVYKKGFGRWELHKSRGRLFSQTSLMRETEEESYLENTPADTTLNSTTGDP